MEQFPLSNVHGLRFSVDGYSAVSGGHHFNLSFPNGYGASLVSHDLSYGGRQGLWEIAVIKDGEIDRSTPITGDVLRYLTKEEALGALKRISLL